MPVASTILEQYFAAWQSHDTSALSRIFTLDADYDIRPRERVLHGLAEIEAYWRRNAARQANLRVHWTLLAEKATTGSTNQADGSKKSVEHSGQLGAYFSADFFDREEQEQQRVTGELYITIASDGRISRLWETYEKTTPAPVMAPCAEPQSPAERTCEPSCGTQSKGETR